MWAVAAQGTREGYHFVAWPSRPCLRTNAWPRRPCYGFTVRCAGARIPALMQRPTPPDAIGRLVAARELVELARTLGQSGAATASGLWGSSVAAVVTAVEAELKRPIVLVCGHID